MYTRNLHETSHKSKSARKCNELSMRFSLSDGGSGGALTFRAKLELETFQLYENALTIQSEIPDRIMKCGIIIHKHEPRKISTRKLFKLKWVLLLFRIKF